jgi:hypothetical protein
VVLGHAAQDGHLFVAAAVVHASLGGSARGQSRAAGVEAAAARDQDGVGGLALRGHPGAAVSASSAASTPITTALRARLPGFWPCPPALLVAPTPGPFGNPATTTTDNY